VRMVTDDDECARPEQDEQNPEDDCKLCHDVKTPVCAASEYLNCRKMDLAPTCRNRIRPNKKSRIHGMVTAN
jgi:hypothetical protein